MASLEFVTGDVTGEKIRQLKKVVEKVPGVFSSHTCRDAEGVRALKF